MRFEDKIKNDLNNAIGKDKEPSNNLFLKVSENLSLTKKKKYNFKPLILSLSCIIILVVCIILINQPTMITSYNAIIIMDVNPSIELIVNEKNEVLSVNGLNDEGKMILCDEEIVGKNLDNALNIIIELEINLGYLTNGTDNEITYTITSKNKEIIQNIKSKTNDFTNQILNKNNISAKINNLEGYTKEELISLVKNLDPTLTIDKINNLDFDQLINEIIEYHHTVKNLATIKLEEYYQQFLKYEIVLKEKGLIKSAIEKSNELYQEFYELYVNLIDELTEAYQSIKENYYNNFISPESDYQKALVELVELKEEYLIQKNIVDNMDEDDLSIIIEKAKLAKLKTEYDVSETTLSSIELACQKSYDIVIGVFENVINNLSILEKRLPSEISSITFQKIYDTTDKINEFKNKVDSDFFEKYKENIMNSKKQLIKYKENMINFIKQNK